MTELRPNAYVLLLRHLGTSIKGCPSYLRQVSTEVDEPDLK